MDTPPSDPTSSRARADAASQAAAGEAFGALDALRGLLADDAPFTFRHGGALHVSEVRMRALEALEQLYRAGGRPAAELGRVTVRKAMPAEEAVRLAQEALEPLDDARREEVAARAAAFLDARVLPDDDEREALLAYRILQELGRVAYREEDVDARSYLTPTQREVAATQLARERPRPHLVVLSGAGDLLGYVWREPTKGRWVVDFAQVPAAADAVRMTQTVLGGLDPRGVPRVAHDEAGRPRRDDDGSLVLDGVVALDAPDPREVLRSLAAFLTDPFDAAVVE